MKNPLAAIKEKFQDKSKLVTELETFTKDEDLWVSRLNTSKGLAHISNAKLLKLHATFTAVKAKFGTRAKMIDAIADLEKRAKDAGFKTRLGAYPVPRLWDMFQAATKRKAASEKGPKVRTAPKAAPPAAAKKTAAAKKPAAGAKNAKKKSGK